MYVHAILVFLAFVMAAVDLKQKPIHKVSCRSHDPAMVSTMLYGYYSEVYKLNEKSHKNYITNFSSGALQYTSDPFCIENSAIKYYIESFSLADNDYAASECTLNTNGRSVSEISPLPNFHNTVHGTVDRLTSELLFKAQRYIESLGNFGFSLYDFEDLDYSLRCEVEPQQLMQVIYREKVIETVLKVVVSVPDKCSFHQLNRDFDTTYDQASITVQIPLTGEFLCQPGQTVSCKKILANSKVSRQSPGISSQ